MCEPYFLYGENIFCHLTHKSAVYGITQLALVTHIHPLRNQLFKIPCEVIGF